MKRITSSEMDSEKTIRSQAKRIRDLEEELEESKNKMATLLQDCFEEGDPELMSFIEQRLKK
jgi:DNA-binding phage protein